MGFDADKDFHIFDDFLKKHSRYTRENLKRDINDYFLPLISKLIAIKGKREAKDGLIVGISAIQGAGKTTQGEVLEILLQHLEYHSCSLSLDDHYITHEQLVQLRKEDARFIRRGVTHDITLAVEDLNHLKKMDEKQPILVPGYDKGMHHGDGDRFRWANPTRGLSTVAIIVEKTLTIDSQPKKVKALHLVSADYKGTKVPLSKDMGSDVPVLPGFLPAKLCDFLKTQTEVSVRLEHDSDVVFEANDKHVSVPKSALPKGWRLVDKKPDFIFYDGWMLGAFPVTDESVFDTDLPGLETEETKQLARLMNVRLGLYTPLWDMIDFLCILYVPNYHMSLLWRDQAEEALRENGQGMSSEEIKEFVHYFWRSIHPAIHIKSLAHDHTRTHQVVIIDDDRTVKEVLTPEVARQRYP